MIRINNGEVEIETTIGKKHIDITDADLIAEVSYLCANCKYGGRYFLPSIVRQNYWEVRGETVAKIVLSCLSSGNADGDCS